MKVYLAGPDVFRPTELTKAWFDHLKAELKKRGHEGLSPFDNEVDGSNISRFELARKIFLGNKAMLDKCDAVLANISPFRGPSCDPGTAWEIGYATALGKPVFTYSYDTIGMGLTYAQRCNIMEKCGLRIRTTEFPVVEDFGLEDNLMIALCSDGPSSCNAEQAIIQLDKYFKEEDDARA